MGAPFKGIGHTAPLSPFHFFIEVCNYVKNKVCFGGCDFNRSSLCGAGHVYPSIPVPVPQGVTPQRMSLRQVFHWLDTNHDGYLTLNEFLAAPWVKNKQRATRFFRWMDTNHDGRVSLPEFLAAYARYCAGSGGKFGSPIRGPGPTGGLGDTAGIGRVDGTANRAFGGDLPVVRIPAPLVRIMPAGLATIIIRSSTSSRRSPGITAAIKVMVIPGPDAHHH